MTPKDTYGFIGLQANEEAMTPEQSYVYQAVEDAVGEHNRILDKVFNSPEVKTQTRKLNKLHKKHRKIERKLAKAEKKFAKLVDQSLDNQS